MNIRNIEIEKYCKILGVKPGDSPEIVKNAFREKIKECHPDRGGDDEKTKLILEAYEKLKNGVPTVARREVSVSKVVFRDFLSRIFVHDPQILRIINDVLDSYGLETISSPFLIEQRWKSQEPFFPSEVWNDFEKAERAFHATMEKFNSQKNRPMKYRVKELMKNLVQVQILYRSLMVKHPSLSSKCKRRLEQIRELIDHAKMTL